MVKKMLIGIVAIALGVAGAVSSVQAGNDKYDDGGQTRGIKIGPLGQRLGAPPAGGAFASAPLTTKQVRGKKKVRGKQAPADEDN